MGLVIENLNKSFGDKVIFTDFSYSFPDTGICVIRGSSGIGKTTLLRIISGLDKQYSGIVMGGGTKNVSFMFQEYRLFPQLSAIENATVSTENTDDDRNSALQILMKLGFSESDCHKKPSQLSGGMKQRVAFARALMKQSKILILDEPTKELDKISENSLLEMIKEAAQKRLVIIVTHDYIFSSTDGINVLNL